MSHYKSNLRDIQFNLFEVLRRQDLLGQPPYDELDEETVRGILGELERLATGPLAESFADADRNPPVFDPATHSVRIPESLRTSYRAFMDAEWYRLSLPAELGGAGAPRSLNWAMAELILDGAARHVDLAPFAPDRLPTLDPARLRGAGR